MSDSPFSKLLELVEFDQEMRVKQLEIDQFMSEIDKFGQQRLVLKGQVDTARTLAHDFKKKLDALELEMKSLDAQQNSKRDLWDGASNNIQLRAIKSEMEQLYGIQCEREEQILELMKDLEHAQADSAKLSKSFDIDDAQLRESINNKEKSILELKKIITELTRLRLDKELAVPEDWREKYGVMRTRVNDPVVPVSEGACSVCCYAVTNHDRMRLERRAIVQCQGCYRLLYNQVAMGHVL